MTVKELIELLQQCPSQSMRVIIDGYEGGYHDLEAHNIGLTEIALNVNDAWYYGPHDTPRHNEHTDETALRLGKSPANSPLLELLKCY